MSAKCIFRHFKEVFDMGNYVEQNLTTNETLVLKAKLNPASLIVKAVCGGIAIILAIVALVVISNVKNNAKEIVVDAVDKSYGGYAAEALDETADDSFFEEIVEAIATPLTVVAWVVIAYSLLKFLFAFLAYINTEFGLTDKRIIGKVGVFKTESIDAPLEKIDNIKLSSGLFGKIFNYYKIEISLGGFDSYTFVNVMDGEALKRSIMKQIDEVKVNQAKVNAEQMAAALAGVKKNDN